MSSPIRWGTSKPDSLRYARQCRGQGSQRLTAGPDADRFEFLNPLSPLTSFGHREHKPAERDDPDAAQQPHRNHDPAEEAALQERASLSRDDLIGDIARGHHERDDGDDQRADEVATGSNLENRCVDLCEG